jgi:hypothetical protein
MKLDTKKILKLKEALGLSWADIAKIGNLKSRQHAALKCTERSLKSADFFAKIFHAKAKDLLK